MNTGLAHAAQAFSRMVNREVAVGTVRCATSHTERTNTIYDSSGITTLLLTDIIGEAAGRSYLLFSEPECVALQNICLSTTLEVEQRTVMGEALLKEIDNVVSAAMITRLSEALGLRIFGGVPQRLRLSETLMNQKLHEEWTPSPGEASLLVSACFLFKHDRQLRPRFLWQFSPAFVRSLEYYQCSFPSDTSS